MKCFHLKSLNRFIDKYKKYTYKLSDYETMSLDVNTYVLALNKYVNIEKEITSGIIKSEIYHLMVKNTLKIHTNVTLHNKVKERLKSITCNLKKLFYLILISITVLYLINSQITKYRHTIIRVSQNLRFC